MKVPTGRSPGPENNGRAGSGHRRGQGFGASARGHENILYAGLDWIAADGNVGAQRVEISEFPIDL